MGPPLAPMVRLAILWQVPVDCEKDSNCFQSRPNWLAQHSESWWRLVFSSGPSSNETSEFQLQGIRDASFDSFLSTDSSVQSFYTANSSFLSTNSSLQSYYTANASLDSVLSTDSSLQSFYTANTSFLSTDSLQSYYTANASVSSFSTDNSTPSHSSDESLPYSVKSINSCKSRKTVLYRRREHPQPAATSSQVRLLIFFTLPQYKFSCRNSPRTCDVLTRTRTDFS